MKGSRSILALLLLFVTSPRGVLAGPIESPGESDIKPGDAQVRVVRFNDPAGGMLLSTDGGDSWKLMCNAVIDASVRNATNGLAIGADGAIYTGSFGGMWRGSADGCSWAMVAEFDGKSIKDIVHDPTDPAVLYAIASSGGEPDNGIFRYDDSTDSWSPMGAGEDILIRALRVIELPGGGLRFYQSMARGTLADGMTPNYIVRYSDDGAESWTESTYGDAGGTLALFAVDPGNPERVAISITNSGDNDSVLISSDGGGSWELVGQPEEFGGGAFGPKGQLWFGDRMAGLFVLPADGANVETLSDVVRPRCVEYHAVSDQLMVCTLFEYGPVDPADGSFAPQMNFSEADGWLECDGQDVAPACEVDFACGGAAVCDDGWCGSGHFPQAPICEAYGYPGLDGDGSGDDAHDDGDGHDHDDGGMTADGSDDDSGDGCGCRAPGGRAKTGSGSAPVALSMLALVLLAVRRRTTRR